MGFVRSVPYRVTTRWLFYQLLQAGHFHSKDDYKGKCVPLLSRARKAFYNGWGPYTLVDDRRDSLDRTGQFESVADWVKSRTEGGFICSLDHFYNQDVYMEIWFEAEAMSRQFQHYTEAITLRPFSGMPSIGYKWAIAKDLEKKSERYNKDIVICYFGDYDKAGLLIPETSIDDINDWCDADFDVDRRGLNEGDGERLGIPESIDKPGAYQWEALPDRAARDLITGSVDEYLDTGLINRAVNDGQKAAQVFDEYLSGFSKFFEEHQDNQL
jgi:hypothetical protein